MYISKQQFKDISTANPQKSPQDLMNRMLQDGFQVEGFNDMSNEAKSGWQEMIKSINDNNPLNPAQQAVGFAKGVGKTANSLSGLGQQTLGRAANWIVNKATGTNEPMKETVQINPQMLESKNLAQGVGEFSEKIAEFMIPGSAVAKGSRIVEGGIEGLGAAKNLGTVGRILEGGAKLATRAGFGAAEVGGVSYLQDSKNPEGAKEAALFGAVIPVAGAAYSGIKSKLTKSADQLIDNAIDKGIKPTILGKQTLGRMDRYKERARQAFKTIVNYKDKIKLKDEFGEATGKLPQNLNQFSQAIDQVKNQIYKKYDALAQSAGSKGARVELNNIVDELNNLTKSEVMQDLSPDVVSYAQQRAKALAKRGTYSTKQSQEAIEQLNARLESFYKNPSPSEFSKLQVDALVVNNMRKSLDNLIENTTSAGYQNLKNLYGSLKTIERDVNKRAIVDARKNAKGLIDFTDIFSAGDIIAGMATMNPAQVGKGVFQKMIATIYKMKNDPNRIIRKAFEGAEKALKTKPQGEISRFITGGATNLSKSE